MSFGSSYSSQKLKRERILQCFGEPRGLSILPEEDSVKGRPEVVHANSVLVPSPIPGSAFVIEWGEVGVEGHIVRLSNIGRRRTEDAAEEPTGG